MILKKMIPKNLRILILLCGYMPMTWFLFAQESADLAIGQADAIVDLRTAPGLELVRGQWKFQEAEILEVDFKAPGASETDPLKLYPTGEAIKTHDISPKAGARDFNDSQWENIAPASLEERRGSGLLSMVWYRLKLTIPGQVGDLPTLGSTAVFEIVMDDYAEIWIDGVLHKKLGQSGGGTIKGWNAPNRVTIGENLKPGQKVQLAILGINGPIADLPENYIWIRSATLDFYKSPPYRKEWQQLGQVVRIDPAVDDIIGMDSNIEKVAGGFQFIEGPVWHPQGYLLFSDPNANVIYAFEGGNGNISIYMTKSGYTGVDIGKYHQPGSNGLALDQQARLTVCQHGNRRVVRIEPKGPVTVLADNYQGKKLNSPNDLVYRSDGALYFTDPPYGLPEAFDDPKKELDFSGVFCLINGELKLVATDLGGPNGIAFSPDEKWLYVSNWDIRDIHQTKIIMRYQVHANGSLSNGQVFFDMNHTDDDEALDGLKVDQQGNIFASGPGGVWIISPSGKYLGKIICGERPANMAWGDDGQTLYMAAHSSLYRIKLKSRGMIGNN